MLYYQQRVLLVPKQLLTLPNYVQTKRAKSNIEVY